VIVGCGDVGLRVATRLRTQGHHVTGIVRSDATAQHLREQQHEVLVHDLDSDVALPIAASIIYYFAPPPLNGSTDPRLRRVLAKLVHGVRIVYISTSGVYGDCAGRWIDEDEPLKPVSERARRRLDAEHALATWGGDYVILRVPGIYGPGRLPRERLQKNLPVVRESESPFTNRIHADDLANVAIKAAERGEAGAAYNVSDGQPTTMCDYFTRCATLLQLPPPPQISLEEARRVFTPAMWSFMEESKRLLTTRLRAQLDFVPRYASLEQGLAACVTP
jgi:nucleoside-diphosphate-sugar epimerase